jgi:hypothetical protein
MRTATVGNGVYEQLSTQSQYSPAGRGVFGVGGGGDWPRASPLGALRRIAIGTRGSEGFGLTAAAWHPTIAIPWTSCTNLPRPSRWRGRCWSFARWRSSAWPSPGSRCAAWASASRGCCSRALRRRGVSGSGSMPGAKSGARVEGSGGCPRASETAADRGCGESGLHETTAAKSSVAARNSQTAREGRMRTGQITPFARGLKGIRGPAGFGLTGRRLASYGTLARKNTCADCRGAGMPFSLAR